MKDQYFGDVNDFRKYGLLREVVLGGLRLGVCWMLTPGDGRTDGRFLSYLDRPQQFRECDPELFDWLRRVVGEEGDRRTARMAQSGLLGDAAAFCPGIVPDGQAGREAYFAAATRALSGCDVVFLDPDNGLEVKSCPRGRKNSCKYLYWDEAAALFAGGASVLIYQHFTRQEREGFVDRLTGSLRERTGARCVLSFRTAHVVFLMAVQEGHARSVLARLEGLSNRWAGEILAREH